MPIYEYRCRQCDNAFEELVFGQASPSCPSCRSKQVTRLLSAFAVGRGGSDPAPAPARRAVGPCGSCGDPRGPGACKTN